VKGQVVIDLVSDHERHKAVDAAAPRRVTAPFGSPRQTLGHRFVYLVVSSRARGLSVGVNLNPDRRCNFDCAYCEVDRTAPSRDGPLDVEVVEKELEDVLAQVHTGRLECYRQVPGELLRLRHVALSGDGEPTLCPRFAEAVRAVVHVRARGQFPFFKIVLLTNATALDQPAVQSGLKLLIQEDEIWAKLDGGTAGYLKRVNRPQVDLSRVLSNLLLIGRQRPIVIQSLFPLLEGEAPADAEIAAYTDRLQGLKAGGAQIALVQIYSATRPAPTGTCGHLPLKTLSRIACQVRAQTGLAVEVF
jgi:wyosine [tRNA(Phe)-imidazoG37] synthetase (radical SAM superfamily)